MLVFLAVLVVVQVIIMARVMHADMQDARSQGREVFTLRQIVGSWIFDSLFHSLSDDIGATVSDRLTVRVMNRIAHWQGF